MANSRNKEEKIIPGDTSPEIKNTVNLGFGTTSPGTVLEIQSSTAEKDKEEEKSPKISSEKDIVVDKDVLKSLIRQNEEFKKQISDLQKNAVATDNITSTMMKTSSKETLVHIRMLKNKVVTGFQNVGSDKYPSYVYPEYNPLTRQEIQFCNVILEDNVENPIKMEYLQFLRESDRVIVKVKEKIELPDLIINQGYVQKSDFANNGYGMFKTMVQVPVDVVKKVYSYKVETEDGRILSLSENCINI